MVGSLVPSREKFCNIIEEEYVVNIFMDNLSATVTYQAVAEQKGLPLFLTCQYRNDAMVLAQT